MTKQTITDGRANDLLRRKVQQTRRLDLNKVAMLKAEIQIEKAQQEVKRAEIWLERLGMVVPRRREMSQTDGRIRWPQKMKLECTNFSTEICSEPKVMPKQIEIAILRYILENPEASQLQKAKEQLERRETHWFRKVRAE